MVLAELHNIPECADTKSVMVCAVRDSRIPYTWDVEGWMAEPECEDMIRDALRGILPELRRKFDLELP